ncbi:TPA: hypothetical protein R1765_001930 [Campylobacter coli]|nr:hypothetical protein [Campylobacter coli]
MTNLDNNANTTLFGGSFILALFYQFLAYLGLTASQVLVMLVVFTFSGIAGILETLALNKNLRLFITTDALSKLLVFFIPFILAIMAKQISVFYYLVDYSFSFLTIGEFFAFLFSIQSIKQKQEVKRVDFYNLFIDKCKIIAQKHLKLDKLEKDDNESKNN